MLNSTNQTNVINHQPTDHLPIFDLIRDSQIDISFV